MSNIKLTTSKQASIFSLPNNKWLLLNRWIGDIVTSGNSMSKNFPGTFPPSFSKSVTAALLWTTFTFNKIAQLANKLNVYSEKRVQGWLPILTAYNKIDENNPVPEDLKNEVSTQLKFMKNDIEKICQLIVPIVKNSNELVSTSLAVSDEWFKNPKKYKNFCEWIAFLDYLTPSSNQSLKLSDSNSSIEILMSLFILSITNDFVSSLEKLKGSWLALSSDLNSIGNQNININNAFLASLDIKISIDKWKALNKVTKSFSQVTIEAEALWKEPDEKNPWIKKV